MHLSKERARTARDSRAISNAKVGAFGGAGKGPLSLNRVCRASLWEHSIVSDCELNREIEGKRNARATASVGSYCVG
jgi:hypothetical protein